MRMRWRQTQCLQKTRLPSAQLLVGIVIALVVVGSACTTTQPSPIGLHDSVFSKMTYDRGVDQTDAILRSVDESADSSMLKSLSDREIYLPYKMTKGLRKKADRARAVVKNMSSADAESLRTLSLEALVMGQPELVEGYLRYTTSVSQRQDPTAAEEQLLLGLAASMMGDEAKARSLLSEAAHSHATSVAARCNLGLLASRRGAHLEALDLFRQAEQLEPANSRIAHLAAETAYASRKYSLAVAAYKKIISRDVNDALAHYNLGLVYFYGMRQLKDAKKHFRIVMDHPRASSELRTFADGAFSNVRREEEGTSGLANADVRDER